MNLTAKMVSFKRDKEKGKVRSGGRTSTWGKGHRTFAKQKRYEWAAAAEAEEGLAAEAEGKSSDDVIKQQQWLHAPGSALQSAVEPGEKQEGGGASSASKHSNGSTSSNRLCQPGLRGPPGRHGSMAGQVVFEYLEESRETDTVMFE